MDLQLLVISSLLKIVFVLAVAVGVFAPVLVWAERRQSAMMQDRVGPHRAGFRLFGKNITILGLLHPLADALKMIWKEDFVPPGADKFLHAVAPMLSVMTGIAIFAVIPFADTLYLSYAGEPIPNAGEISGPAIPMQIAQLDAGVLFVFAVAGAGILGAAVGGYASDNKYSLLGGLRAAGQMVSYEVVLGLSLVGAFMVFDTVRLEEMVRWQAETRLFGWLPAWGIFVQPLGFFLYLGAAIAETKRIPFDVPEGESEIVGGYLTEYSGMKFGMFFMSEFIEIVALSALATTIFMGGWDLPFLHRSGVHIGGLVHWEIAHGWVIALQVLVFLLKMVVFMWLQLTIRWTLPRFRYDQIMMLCWKLLLPLTLINIMATGLILLLVT